MDRSGIRLEIRRLIQDTSTDPNLQRFLDDILNTRIDNIHEEIAALTRMNETRGTDIDSAAGTQEYTLPANFLSPITVLFKTSSGVYVPVEKITEQELDKINPEWRDTNNTADPPSNYYIRIEKIGFYPTPSTTRTSAIRLDYVRRITALSGDSSIPFDELYKYYPYHMTICFGVAKLCTIDDRKDITVFNKEYNEGIQKIMREVSMENEDTRMPNIYEYARSSPRRSR